MSADGRLRLRSPEFDHYNVDTTPTLNRLSSVEYNKIFMSANLKYGRITKLPPFYIAGGDLFWDDVDG